MVSLSTKKRELLALLKEKEGLKQAISRPLPQITADWEHLYDPFPSGEMQRIYWKATHAHMYFELEILDEFDVNRQERALQKLIERHPMLRAIVLPNGQYQILKQVPPFHIEQEDISKLPPEEALKQLLAIRHCMIHHKPSADQWPLFVWKVYKVGEKNYRIFICFSLLIDDGQSNKVFFHELEQLYEEPDAQLPPLQISYRDYVLALSPLRELESYQSAKNYWWKRIPKLVNCPTHELPFLIEPQKVLSPRLVRRTVFIDCNSWEILKWKSQRIEITPSGLLLAAFTEILSRWFKSHRFILFLMYANRNVLHPQVDELFGNFSSLLLFEVNHSQEENFEEYAQDIQKQLWEDYEHSMVSGLDVLLEIKRVNEDSTPVFIPVVFASNLFANIKEEGGKEISNPTIEKFCYSSLQRSMVGLDIQILDVGGVLSLNCDVIEELIPAGFVEDILNQYKHLLEILANDEAVWRITPTSPTICLQSAGENRPIFCIHPVNGGVFGFMQLVKQCGKERPFYGFQAQGLEGEREPIKSIEEMARYYVRSIRHIQEKGPYILSGYSFGGLVAFEMAKQLSEHGDRVEHLFILDGVAPLLNQEDLKEQGFRLDDGRWLKMVAGMLERAFKVSLNLSSAELEGRDENELQHYFIEKVLQAGPFSDDKGEIKRLQGLLNVTKTNYQAMLSYLPKPYGGSITVFRAKEKVSRDAILTINECYYNRYDLGWGAFSPGPVTLYEVPGDHYSMLTMPHVKVLWKLLQELCDYCPAEEEKK